MWADDFVGIPFAMGGRNDRACDCGGLVRLVLRRRFGIEIADRGWHNAPAAIAGAMRKGPWTRVDAPRAGDVVVMMTPVGVGRVAPLHVGIMASPTACLHVDIGMTSVCQPISAPQIAHRIEGFYRHDALI